MGTVDPDAIPVPLAQVFRIQAQEPGSVGPLDFPVAVPKIVGPAGGVIDFIDPEGSHGSHVVPPAFLLAQAAFADGAAPGPDHRIPVLQIQFMVTFVHQYGILFPRYQRLFRCRLGGNLFGFFLFFLEAFHRSLLLFRQSRLFFFHRFRLFHRYGGTGSSHALVAQGKATCEQYPQEHQGAHPQHQFFSFMCPGLFRPVVLSVHKTSLFSHADSIIPSTGFSHNPRFQNFFEIFS